MEFEIRSKVLKDINFLLVSLDKCHMKFQFLLNRSHNVTIIAVHAPTVTSPDDVKECFLQI